MSKINRIICVFVSSCLCLSTASAQLVDSTQVTPTVPGGTITKSLQDQIGAGRGDDVTANSSIYLINRDPARSIRRGRQLFQRKFTANQGLGPRVNPDSTGNIMTNPALGAGISDSCAGCHGRPRGAAGFGGVVPTRPDSRDSPHLFGLGLQEMLADEMTTDLRAIRDSALSQAVNTTQTVTLDLVSKGISFGKITAHSDSTLDFSDIEGIDEDLRVKPFFAHGGAFSIRQFIVGAFKDEMGMESNDPDLTNVAAGQTVVTPSGMVLNGAVDTLSAPPVASADEDNDNDGVKNEIDTAVVDHLEFYLLNYFKPAIGKTTTRTTEGKNLMSQVGCIQCHVPDLTINSDRRVADVETNFDAVKGIFNRLFAEATTLYDAVDDGESYKKLVPQKNSFVVKNIYTDFKRHDLGTAFHERQYDGSITTETITEPLWGVGTTAPYGHDGRSINLEEVIVRHGGDAESSKNQFVALADDDQRKIIEFLQTLVLFPPDDTASNLNAGDKNGNPQDPANHGSINLGALFTTPDPAALVVSQAEKSPINLSIEEEGNNLVIEFQDILPGTKVDYRLQSTTDIEKNQWQPEPENAEGPDQEGEYKFKINKSTNEKSFYRVTVESGE